MIQGGFLSERKGKVTPCRWTEDRKGVRTNSGESDTRNLEAESIRSRWCVMLKIVSLSKNMYWWCNFYRLAHKTM